MSRQHKINQVMVHVSILVPQDCVLLNSVERVYNIFNTANIFLSEKNKEQVFELHLTGAQHHEDLYGGYSLQPDLLLANNPQTSLIIVPPLAGDIAGAIQNNHSFIPWINGQWRQGAVVAGLCTGIFLLEGINFVNDDDCIMNWFIEPAFRKQFSQLNKLAEKVIAEDELIHSSSGAYSFIDGLLQKIAGAEVAQKCAALFEDEFNRECQSVISISNRQKDKTAGNHSETFHNAMHYIPAQSFTTTFSLQNTDTAIGDTHIADSINYSNSKIFKQVLKKSARKNNQHSILH